MEERLPKGTLGGQAVIEGVMMKGKDSYSVAVRKPDKKIEVQFNKYQSYGEKHAFARIPFIRGVVNFVESLAVGMKTLSYSSSFFEEEEEETKADKFIKDVFKEKAESVILGVTLVLSVILAIALFMMLPAVIGEFIGKWVESRILLSLIEGIIRLLIFILYVVLISQMEDIKRLFKYHGAEHKTINCYEAGDDLTPENVAKHSRYHKRCGTSFLFVVMVVSIVIFMFITAEQMWLRFLLRLVLIPVVAGVSYEFIRLAGRTDNVIMNVLSIPGMWIQKLTTKESEEEMIQVAIISVESVLYGKPYVDAVNEAQGLGKKSKEQAENTATAKKANKEIKNMANVQSISDAQEDVYEEEFPEPEDDYMESGSFIQGDTLMNSEESSFAFATDNRTGYEERTVEFVEDFIEITEDKVQNDAEESDTDTDKVSEEVTDTKETDKDSGEAVGTKEADKVFDEQSDIKVEK